MWKAKHGKADSELGKFARDLAALEAGTPGAEEFFAFKFRRSVTSQYGSTFVFAWTEGWNATNGKVRVRNEANGGVNSSVDVWAVSELVMDVLTRQYD